MMFDDQKPMEFRSRWLKPWILDTFFGGVWWVRYGYVAPHFFVINDETDYHTVIANGFQS